MKKQILFLTFFILATFAGTSKSFGQNTEEAYLDAGSTPACTPAVALTCGDLTDELNPMPGTTYTYTITSSSAPSQVLWFVTNGTDIWIDGAINPALTIDPDGGTGQFIMDAENGIYNSGANTDLSIDISWKSFDFTNNDVLLVAYVVDAANCTDNIQAWKIVPQYNFTLDIAAIEDDGSLQDPSASEECVSPIVSATFDPAANSGAGALVMDYGENYVFFTVNAANWQTEWNPAFTEDPSSLATIASEIMSIQWAYPDQAVGSGAIWHDDTDNVQASHYETAGTGESVNGFVGSNGACIVVKVEVDHTNLTPTQNELLTLAGETVIIGVDGEMIDPATDTYSGAYPDLDNPTGGSAGDACVNNYTDEASYVITPRPKITESNPTNAEGPFVPKN